MRDRLKLAVFCAAIAAAIVVGSCVSAWDCELNGPGITCYRVVHEPEPA